MKLKQLYVVKNKRIIKSTVDQT